MTVTTQAVKPINYILTSKETPVGYQVRPRAMVFVEGKGLREICYVKGGHSIYKEDYPKDVRVNHLWFENGQLIVKPEDKLLIEYLETHPDYGLRFKRNDPAQEARDKLKLYKQRDEVKVRLAQMENFDALAEALARKDQQVFHLTHEEKELLCYMSAEEDPERVIKAIADPATNAKYIVSLAMNKNIIRPNFQRTALVWNDSGDAIISLPLGKKAVDVLAEFLLSKDGEGTLAELNLRITKHVEGRDVQDYELETINSADVKKDVRKYEEKFGLGADETAEDVAEETVIADPEEVVVKKVARKTPGRKRTSTRNTKK